MRAGSIRVSMPPDEAVSTRGKVIGLFEDRRGADGLGDDERALGERGKEVLLPATSGGFARTRPGRIASGRSRS